MSSSPALSVGALLKRHRRAAHLTQEELAERAGISVDTISALERGVNLRPRRDTIDQLADTLVLAPAQRATCMRWRVDCWEAALAMLNRLGERLYATQVEQELAGQEPLGLGLQCSVFRAVVAAPLTTPGQRCAQIYGTPHQCCPYPAYTRSSTVWRIIWLAI